MCFDYTTVSPEVTARVQKASDAIDNALEVYFASPAYENCGCVPCHTSAIMDAIEEWLLRELREAAYNGDHPLLHVLPHGFDNT